MRINAGELKGRRLLSPRNDRIRPTNDKVKEAMFSMLLPWMEGDFTVVDLFTGSGNLGIEAISRGAKRVFFSDSSRESLSLARENISLCGVEDRAILLNGDFKSNIKRINEPVDIYLLDPPYADGCILPALQAIEEKGNLRPGGVIVCEHSHKDRLPEEVGSFVAIKDRKYGAIGVTIYQQKAYAASAVENDTAKSREESDV
ncbi:MAG: 16S rRNA (guanine(966)-N(2))-methyltransferase RsmD [Firmicutes bacterium]|nr:16S rRNA (guanine(966)-N(2))-methyltransferase RsmD [Bacillota bacterium]